MLSTAADLVSLAGAAPWLAVAVLCLLAAAWVYRQSRRATAALRTEVLLAVGELREDATSSATRQGKRLGNLENFAELSDVRRRQTESALAAAGAPLPDWPPDGPLPRPSGPRHYADDLDDAWTRESPAVPPLPDYSEHRRERNPL